MAEFLFVRAASRRPPGSTVGEPIMIESDGHGWGSGELDATIFRIVRVAGITRDAARAIFFRDGVPGTERAAATEERAAFDVARQELDAALAADPVDPARVQVARGAVQAARDAMDRRDLRIERFPKRRFHLDLTALGAGGTKTLLALRQSCRRKALAAFHDALASGATKDVALAASLAGETPVTDFVTATTED